MESKVLYVISKKMSGKLSCIWTGLAGSSSSHDAILLILCLTWLCMNFKVNGCIFWGNYSAIFILAFLLSRVNSYRKLCTSRKKKLSLYVKRVEKLGITVKPAYVVTFIKGSPVFSSHLSEPLELKYNSNEPV